MQASKGTVQRKNSKKGKKIAIVLAPGNQDARASASASWLDVQSLEGGEKKTSTKGTCHVTRHRNMRKKKARRNHGSKEYLY